jgi:hypothetical protein
LKVLRRHGGSLHLRDATQKGLELLTGLSEQQVWAGLRDLQLCGLVLAVADQAGGSVRLVTEKGGRS